MLIKIDTGALENAASKVDAVAGEVVSQGNSIIALSGDVSTVWESQYTLGFNESFSIVQQKLNIISANLTSIAQQLRSTALEIERVESENASRFGGGFGGGGGGSR